MFRIIAGHAAAEEELVAKRRNAEKASRSLRRKSFAWQTECIAHRGAEENTGD
jgi:hypothetical protein